LILLIWIFFVDSLTVRAISISRLSFKRHFFHVHRRPKSGKRNHRTNATTKA